MITISVSDKNPQKDPDLGGKLKKTLSRGKSKNFTFEEMDFQYRELEVSLET